jgi:streptogramin lyase
LLSAITEFPLPAGHGASSSLTVGPDGNLWFPYGNPSAGVNGIGRITPSGAVTEFPLTNGDRVSGVTVGPDGNLWFTERNGDAIGRVTPSGAVTDFPLPTTMAARSDPLTVGPDGNLWFMEYQGGIGRITPSGAVTDFPLPTAGLEAGPLTVGPDGNLWFRESEFGTYGLGQFVFYGPTQRIGRITPSGAVTEFPLPTGSFPPGALTVGPDGNLWFTESKGAVGPEGRIGRITPSGAVTDFPLPTTGADAEGPLTVGPDGNLWFSEYHVSGATGGIGRITPSGVVTDFPLPTAGNYAGALTVGPDGNLWFTEGNPGAIWFPGGNMGTIGEINPASPPVTGVTGTIGEINPAPPRVTGVDAVAHSRKGITSILVGFDVALDPGSAGEGGFYSLAAGVKRHHKLVFRRGVKIRSVSYDGTAHTVTLQLARPHKGRIQVTVRAGIMAAAGVSSSGEFTTVIR